MKAVILEIRDGLAAALREDGVVVRTRADGAAVGDTIELKTETVVLPSRRRRIARTAAAAMLVLVLTGGSLTYMGNTASAYVSLDTEEVSVELSVNTFGRVIGVRALDDASGETAKALARELHNKPMDAALDAARERLCGGEERAQTVVAGVTAGNDNRRSELKSAVERSFGQDGGAVRLCALSMTPQERRDADAHSMSPGRYAMEQRGESFPPPPPGGEAPFDDREDWKDRDDGWDDGDDDDREAWEASPARPDERPPFPGDPYAPPRSAEDPDDDDDEPDDDDGEDEPDDGDDNGEPDD